MLRLTVLKVGAIRESFYREGMAEYEKRLRPYARVEIRSVRGEPVEGPAGAASTREGEKLGAELDRLSPSRVVVLDPKGRTMTSPGLARFLERQSVSGHSSLCFVIGGTTGLSGEILARAHTRWSLSTLTFPHQMVPLILLEQLYRAFRILRGEPYHH